MNLKYSELEMGYEEHDYVRKTVEGRKVGCSKCVGYCNYDGHRGYLTLKERDKHMCIGKGCNYYIPKMKAEKVPGWLNTSDLSLYFKTSEDQMRKAKKAVAAFQGMAITGMSRNDKGNCEFSYVAISNSYDIKSVARALSEEFGTNVTFKKINCSYDHAVKVIFNMEVA